MKHDLCQTCQVSKTQVYSAEDFHPRYVGETVIARFSHFVYHTGMLRQIGAFIFLVGVFLIILFLMAETKDGLALRFLCWGAPLIVLSFLIWNRTRSRGASTRFRMIKKILTRKKKEK